jgi:CRISPR/Cas system CSM-associated protein Csm3 (group 7 of RAMP superfamily)
MLKATFLEGTIHLTIQPDGPLLIKAGDTGGADPTRPDMEFVRTRAHGKEQIYLPGSSLKGVVRAQCERICRSLDGKDRYEKAKERAHRLTQDNNEFVPPLADNPLINEREYKPYKGGNDASHFSSGVYFNKLRQQDKDKDKDKDKELDTAIIYRRSALTSQMFGHTSLAGRIRFADAYDTEPETQRERVEMRNGVAIDRVYGSVAVGPFNYETLVCGSFKTTITFRNTTLAQLGLLGLALRDLGAGRVGVGFGKSRGLGRVSATLNSFELRYPTCDSDGDNVFLLGRANQPIATTRQFMGLGALCSEQTYHLPDKDIARLPDEVGYQCDLSGMGLLLTAIGNEAVQSIWRACMPCWKKELDL